jgi:hypothetical protein
MSVFTGSVHMPKWVFLALQRDIQPAVAPHLPLFRFATTQKSEWRKI